MLNDIIVDTIRLMRAGASGEHPKRDFKSGWYPSSGKSWQEELAKDVAALANTPGDDGVLVFGVGQDGKVFGCALQPLGIDEAEIQRQIARRIDPPPRVTIAELEVEAHIITCLIVQRSTSRPHVIRSWRNRDNYIPVRRGTDTWPAGRHELDEMYASRLRSGSVRFGRRATAAEVIAMASSGTANGMENYYALVEIWISNASAEVLIVDHVTLRWPAEARFPHRIDGLFRFPGTVVDVRELERSKQLFPLTIGLNEAWAGTIMVHLDPDFINAFVAAGYPLVTNYMLQLETPTHGDLSTIIALGMGLKDVHQR